jgi:hypothetical protein
MKAERLTNGQEGDGFSSNGSREKQQVDLLHLTQLIALREVQLKAVVLK